MIGVSLFLILGLDCVCISSLSSKIDLHMFLFRMLSLGQYLLTALICLSSFDS